MVIFPKMPFFSQDPTFCPCFPDVLFAFLCHRCPLASSDWTATLLHQEGDFELWMLVQLPRHHILGWLAEPQTTSPHKGVWYRLLLKHLFKMNMCSICSIGPAILPFNGKAHTHKLTWEALLSFGRGVFCQDGYPIRQLFFSASLFLSVRLCSTKAWWCWGCVEHFSYATPWHQRRAEYCLQRMHLWSWQSNSLKSNFLVCLKGARGYFSFKECERKQKNQVNALREDLFASICTAVFVHFFFGGGLAGNH